MEGKSRAGELPLQEFARNIENKNVEAIEGYLANDLRYKVRNAANFRSHLPARAAFLAA